jgi:xanthine/uracil permease
MSDSLLTQLSYLDVAYAGLVAIGAGVVFALRRERPKMLDQSAWILEVLLLIRFAAGVGALLHGQKAAEPSPYLGYLFASVCIMPVALGTMREDRGRWSSGVIAVVGVALAVISVRLQMTWGPHG